MKYNLLTLLGDLIGLLALVIILIVGLGFSLIHADPETLNWIVYPVSPSIFTE